MRVGLVLLALSPLLAGRALTAQGTAEATNYRFEAWTTDRGLPQNSVTTVLQTHDGYLWVGTFGGLARFDGVRFTVFDISNTAELGTNRILSLFEDSKNALWVGTQGGGLTRFQDGEFEHFGVDQGAPRGDVWAIAEDESGALWFGGYGLTRYAAGEFESRLPANDEAVTLSIRVEDPETLWLGTDSGAVHYVRGSARTYTIEDGLPGNNVPWIDRDDAGTLWASTSDGLAVLSRDRFVAVEAPTGPIEQVLTSTRGTRWVAADGLFRMDAVVSEDSFDEVVFGLLTDSSVRSLTEDREGNLWIGTNGEGLLRMRPSIFGFLGEDDGLPGGPSLVTTDPLRGDVWMVVADSALLRCVEGEITPVVDTVQEAFSGTGRSVHLARDGATWIFNGQTVSRIHQGGVEVIEHGLGGIFDPILEDEEGVLWFGTLNGVGRIEGRDASEVPLPPGRQGPVSVHAGAGERIWLNTPDGIGKLVEDHLEFLEIDPFPKGAIRSMHESGGALWITTYGSGLGCYLDGELIMFTEANGLPDNSLGGLLADERGHFWINSNRGVFCVRRDDLLSPKARSRGGITCRLLRTGEGNGGSACIGPDGRLWFPTLYGVALIDSSRARVNTIPPQLAVESVEVGGRRQDIRSDIVLPPGHSDLVIEYTGLSFVDPHDVRFRYRLVGYDRDWISVGQRRRAYYTNIPPGAYRFEVIACNDDGVWNEVGASLDLELLPHFYQTGWFLALCLGSFGLGLVFFYKARTGAIRHRNIALRTEIQERERAEVMLRESEERYRVVAEAATDAILTVDELGRIAYANPATERIFGRSPEKCLGEDLSSLMPNRIDDDQELDSNEHWEGRELIGKHLDGHTFPVEVSLGVLRPMKGRPRFTCIVRDITERRRTEQERARLEERLRESKKMEAMGRLAGGISHDFNNILTAMISHAELLDERIRKGESSGTLEHVAEIQECTQLAFSLTNQLLAFSRRQVVQPMMLAPSEVLGRLEPMLRRLIREDVDLVVEASEGVGPIRADVGQLEQIIMNLVLNGCDAMPDGGSLTVQVAGVELDEIYAACNPQASAGPHVLIVVADTGVGIDEDVMPHLFEPFFTTKSIGQGTGLGLASVHGIVQQSGGHITVTSEPGSGTTFRVYLPRQEGRPQPADSSAKKEGPLVAARGAETVLVCDDYPAVRRATQMILANHGYEVLSADGPEAALRIASEHPTPINLLITDVVMPGMNGPQLAKKVEALQPRIRVLFVSGYTSDVVIHEGVAERGTSFLQKPFVFKELLQRIRELLDAPVKA